MTSRIVLVGVALFIWLVAGRTVYRAWLKERRRHGHYTRSVVLVGTNEDGIGIARLLAEHPEAGYRLCGVVGDRNEAAETGAPWLGEVSEARSAVMATRASGAILVAGAMPPYQLNGLARQLLRDGVHVHLQVGLQGVAYNRLRIVPFAYEPVLYLEQAALSRWQVAAKRAFDVVAAAAMLVLFSPVLAAATVAIYAEDRGPVVFRQWRVGRDGKLFKLYKLRTMVTDAEKRLAELQAANQRDGGPLFKLAADPRVTRVGRLLRATSIDELPQLVNVLRGEMSLVGPRPALPAEMAAFDERLRERTKAIPGITGLWQVEARDNPAFGPYQRLDLYYVDNWSVGLDITILISTVAVVLARAWHAVVPMLPGKARQRAPTGVLE